MSMSASTYNIVGGTRIVLGIIIIIVLMGIVMMFRSNLLINRVINAKTQLEYPSHKLPLSNKNKGVTWSFVTCLYVDDWEYRYGSDKYIFNWTNDNDKGVRMYFDYKTNNLNIDMTTIPLMSTETVVISDIPIQKWMTIVLCLENRNIDVFMDGELVKTQKLMYVPYYSTNNITLFPDGGFNGKMGYFQYFNYKLSLSNIKHFNNVKKALTHEIPFYKPSFYTITYFYKLLIDKLIIIINRIFKFINNITLDFIVYITNFIKYLLWEIYFYMVHFF
jgi:hypothetical protein